MRPKLITPAKVLLAVLAMLFVGGLIYWQRSGGKVIGIDTVPSTAGKIAFVREENGTSDLYMTDAATGANTVALTNDNKGIDSEPAWAPDGETLALTSDRNGVVRQLYVMNATPGATVAVRTKSSSTKELPQYGPEQEVYFLDAGRIAKITPETAETDAVFPTVEQKRTALKELFGFGGVSRFAISPDGKRFFVAVKQERGEALVAWVPEENAVAALGVAEKVLFRFLPDGTLIAVFVGGEPYPKTQVLFNDQAAGIPDYSAPALPPLMTSDTNVLVKVDTSFGIAPISPIPFSPSGISAASDGKQVALTSMDKKGDGVYLVNLSDPNGGGQLATLPASEPEFSPDNSQIAFVSGNDIYTLPIAGGGQPKNLTQGKGRNVMPTWSPRKAAK